jgi:dTDP-4-dehydrorhamnose reductase
MKMLVTGAAGLVGSHVARVLACDHDVFGLKHSDLDISDADAVDHCVVAFRPELIINCAVIQVDESERNPSKAHAVNVEGPRFLAAVASRIGAEMVHFSTQYAFDGEPLGRPPYTIADTPRPVNLYGRTKVASEAAVRESNNQSYIIRTSWVYGSGKNSFLCTVHSDLRSGKAVLAIDDIWSSTTYVDDLIEQLLLILNKRRYGTYPVVNEGVCSYYEFALEAGRLVGLNREQVDPLIEVAKESEMQRIAARPHYTPMRCLLSEKLGLPPMRHWRDALSDYVDSVR